MNILRVSLLASSAGSIVAFMILAFWTSVHYGPTGLVPIPLLDTMTGLLLVCTVSGLLLVMTRKR